MKSPFGNFFAFVSILVFCSGWLLACSTQAINSPAPTIDNNQSVTTFPSATDSPMPPTLTPILSTQTPVLSSSLTGKIAFAGHGLDKNNGFIYSSIGIADANGQNLVYLKKTYGEDFFSFPTWSPDGSHIAYIAIEADNMNENIYVVSTDGNQIDLIKTGTQSVSGLSWSPDGNQMIYSGDVTTQSDIFMIDPSSKTIKQLTNSSYPEDFPSWSPDGDRIAFLRFDLSKYGDGAHLYLTDTSGQNQIQLGEILAAPSRISWSPDGEQIAFRSMDGCGDIYVVEIDGSNVYRLSNLPGGEKDPVWSPDGNFIAFSASDFVCNLSSGGEPVYAGWQPYIVSAQGGKPVELTLAEDLDIFNLAWLH